MATRQEIIDGANEFMKTLKNNVTKKADELGVILIKTDLEVKQISKSEETSNPNIYSFINEETGNLVSFIVDPTRQEMFPLDMEALVYMEKNNVGVKLEFLHREKKPFKQTIVFEDKRTDGEVSNQLFGSNPKWTKEELLSWIERRKAIVKPKLIFDHLHGRVCSFYNGRVSSDLKMIVKQTKLEQVRNEYGEFEHFVGFIHSTNFQGETLLIHMKSKDINDSLSLKLDEIILKFPFLLPSIEDEIASHLSESTGKPVFIHHTTSGKPEQIAMGGKDRGKITVGIEQDSTCSPTTISSLAQWLIQNGCSVFQINQDMLNDITVQKGGKEVIVGYRGKKWFISNGHQGTETKIIHERENERLGGNFIIWALVNQGGKANLQKYLVETLLWQPVKGDLKQMVDNFDQIASNVKKGRIGEAGSHHIPFPQTEEEANQEVLNRLKVPKDRFGLKEASHDLAELGRKSHEASEKINIATKDIISFLDYQIQKTNDGYVLSKLGGKLHEYHLGLFSVIDIAKQSAIWHFMVARPTVFASHVVARINRSKIHQEFIAFKQTIEKEGIEFPEEIWCCNTGNYHILYKGEEI